MFGAFVDTVTSLAWWVWLTRVAVVFTSLYNIGWTFPGLLQLLKGNPWPIPCLKTGLFLLSTGTFFFHLLILTGLDHSTIGVWALACLLLMLAGHFSLAHLHYTGMARKIDRFFGFYPHIGKALPIVELATLDPHTADEINRQTILTLVERLIETADKRVEITPDD